MKIKGFTLFEVLISLVILGVILSAVSRLHFANDSMEVYYTLQKIENTYIETKAIVNTKNIKLK
jgi:prepilin-type N-terminal cleavage/methylation domain-containing protein